MSVKQGGNTIAGGGTTDQTYSPTSTNAQSGVAVAQAVATKQDSATALTTTNTYYSGTTLYIG